MRSSRQLGQMSKTKGGDVVGKPVAFDLLVFDLDGTLIDSRLDLALAVNAAREDGGMGPLDHELIYSYVGNGAPMLIRRSLGPEAADQQVERALQFFYGYYREHMLDNTYLYPGVQESLDTFLADGRQLAVLTNKPVRFSQEIIQGLGLAAHFQRVYGGNSFETKKPDPYGLNFLMDELGASKAARSLSETVLSTSRPPATPGRPRVESPMVYSPRALRSIPRTCWWTVCRS